MTASLRELQQKLEAEVQLLRGIQKDLGKHYQMRRQYALQLSENEMVQQELERLEDDANVFKLIGPVLVKQDVMEAKGNVAKRLEYIDAESRRLDAVIKGLEQKQDVKREDVLKVQQRLQAAQAQAAATSKGRA
eukprot:TRINITY_DN12176_c0_g1_i1.p1 TRINITY_DN12176_c0_g1~~TRINITY_DN12176_c0_g1_i1.p1  ORF type:complete len:134 (+),score=50.28 TRINITY_DN12176_c0_g1_i1:194-595(+)